MHKASHLHQMARERAIGAATPISPPSIPHTGGMEAHHTEMQCCVDSKKSHDLVRKVGTPAKLPFANSLLSFNWSADPAADGKHNNHTSSEWCPVTTIKLSAASLEPMASTEKIHKLSLGMGAHI